MTDSLPGRLATELALRDVRRVDGGHQAMVFTATMDGIPVIVKVIDAACADPTMVRARVSLVARLAEIDPHVCHPIPHEGRLVRDVLEGGALGLATIWERADGRAPDPAEPSDVRQMGVSLARLHAAMATQDAGGLPPVAAYAGAPESSSWQLLHGDFNAGNLRMAGDTVRIFDFDDCGRGPVAFDVANAIYMVMFDAHVAHTPDIVAPFRAALLDGYWQQSGVTFPGETIDREIARRVDALAGWLAEPSTAPIGIRTSSAEWREVLHAFVRHLR